METQQIPQKTTLNGKNNHWSSGKQLLLKLNSVFLANSGFISLPRREEGGKEGLRAWKAATAVGEVGKRGTQDRARGRRQYFFAKRVGLAGLKESSTVDGWSW